MQRRSRIKSTPKAINAGPAAHHRSTEGQGERGWNLILPESEHGGGLNRLEYTPLCEIMGRSPIGPEIFDCSGPDTGNMEVMARRSSRSAG
jgi:acyl-CoA dehydrogenase